MGYYGAPVYEPCCPPPHMPAFGCDYVPAPVYPYAPPGYGSQSGFGIGLVVVVVILLFILGAIYYYPQTTT